MWIESNVYVKKSMRSLCSTAAVRSWRHNCMVDEEHGVFVRGVDSRSSYIPRKRASCIHDYDQASVVGFTFMA